jgi:DUF1009 family protein
MKPGAGAVATPSNRPLAIIAGGGSVPVHVARAAIQDGRRVMVVGIEGEADETISEFPHDWFQWGQLGHLEKILSSHGKGDVVLIGGVKTRPDFKRLKLDFGAVRMLPTLVSLMANGDNTVLTGAIRLVESWGHTVVGAHEIAGDLVATAGALTDKPPRSDDLDDANRAMAAARAIGAIDAGQAAVAVDGRIVALEAAEGTDGVLARIVALRQGGRLKWRGRAGVLAKCPKPQQDLRVDMPTIGPSTVAGVDAAGLAGIAIEAGHVMIVEREETLRRAEATGVFIFAMKV